MAAMPAEHFLAPTDTRSLQANIQGKGGKSDLNIVLAFYFGQMYNLYMLEIMEQIKKLSLDEQALIAFDIQKSFEDYDEDLTDAEKRGLDKTMEEIENGTMMMYSAEEVMERLSLKYGI
jgi:Putative addiction module component